MGAQQEHDRVLMDDLDAYVAGDDQVPEDGPPPPPDNADEANQILRRVGRLEREAESIEKLAQSELDRIEAWRDDRILGVERALAFQVSTLEGWMRAQNTSDPKRKTINLPNGQLRVRPKRVTIYVHDAATAIAAHPEWDSTKPTFDRQTAGPLLREGPALGDGEWSGETPPTGFHYCIATTIPDVDKTTGEVIPGVMVPGIYLVVPNEDTKTFGYTAKEQAR